MLQLSGLICAHHPATPGLSPKHTILPPRVWVSSTPSMLLSFFVQFVLYLSREKNENKQKEAVIGSFVKNIATFKNVF